MTKKRREERSVKRQAEVIADMVRQKRDAIAAGEPCVVCGQKATVVGVFAPNPEFSRKLGVQVNKQRIIVYACCDEHMRRPEELEAKLERDFAGIGQFSNTIPGESPPIFQHEMN